MIVFKTYDCAMLELIESVLSLRLTQRLVGVPRVVNGRGSVLFRFERFSVLVPRKRTEFCGVFFANRIWEIQMSTPPVQWQHLRTDDNPANLYSRGASLQELSECSFW